MMHLETLKIKDDSRVITATINRPERNNSMNRQLVLDLGRVLDMAESAEACRMVVIQGQNGIFCTGMDFNEVTEQALAGHVPEDRGGEAFMALLKRFTSVPRVLVAKVDGRVTAGGVGIVAACDFALATPRSTFSLSEALWGLLPCCVLPFLIRRVGFQPAYAMTLSTQTVTANKAERDHLVDQLTENPDDAIRKLLLRLTRLDHQTIADLKGYFRKMWIIDDHMEQTAIQEFTRLVSKNSVQENIMRYVTQQTFPWEH